ncbi:alkaline phosphatase family protein [Bosea sp. ASV33]|uniref:alkaline phosphatase family protein n=1 Tax=Bosea sp. ASV33 TaxID=2795106 RepID=UPI0018ED6674|nr:alkaline phosphatase family protein [Bosea sp. ASV33]
MDGSEPAYIEAASAKGLTPHLDRIMRTGASTHAYSVIPSFTNPNNLSIITGRPPAWRGIAGDFFYDREAKEEVMMSDARFLRAPTILAEFQKAGFKVAMVTAKDKLRTLNVG